jgi:plastocyanin
MHRNETLFYVFGIGLAVSAVVFSFLGLKVKGFPGRAFPGVVAWFAILIIGATTFSVLHAQDEEKAKAAETEKANEEFEADDADVQAEEAAEEEEAGKSGDASQPGEGEGEIEGELQEGGDEAAAGPGGTLQLAADPAAIAYDTTELTSKPGKVTIDFDNPAPLEHDVVVEDEAGDELARSEIVTESETSAEADLAAGSYTFFCSIPGHREAGMEGTLTVK